MTRSLIFTTLLFAAAAAQAVAGTTTYTFTYSDIYGVKAHGTLSGTDSGLGNGSIHVTGGSLMIDANPQHVSGGKSSLFPDNHYVGTYDLLPIGPSYYSFHGITSGDNLLYPTPGSAGQYLDSSGLLFGDASTAAASTIAINIYNAGFLTAGLPTFGFQLVNKNPSGQYYTDLATWSPKPARSRFPPYPSPPRSSPGPWGSGSSGSSRRGELGAG